MPDHRGSWFVEALTALATRNPGRTEADIQSNIKNVLLCPEFELGEQQVRLETPVPDRRRIDVEVGALVIECKRDLRPQVVLRAAEQQLEGYLRARESDTTGAYVGVLTDGVSWLHYQTSDTGLRQVSRMDLRPGQIDERSFRIWLGALLSTERALQPTSTSIRERLGMKSPACRGLLAQLDNLWASGRGQSDVKVKRGLWAKLLRTAFGTQFENRDQLFVEHTYLVLVATLIAHMVVGYEAEELRADPHQTLTGRMFSQNGIRGVGEAAFFNWVLDVPGGRRVVADIARRLSVFSWGNVDHDVLKALYQSVVTEETRHALGEYYTADWLAAGIVNNVITDPLDSRVLDPACGSGTFLFHAVRRFLEAADEAGQEASQAVRTVLGKVYGMDLHPVAVTLAQVTYLLAIGAERITEVATPANPVSIPVYLGDSMRWDATELPSITAAGEVVVPTGEGGALFERELRFPAAVVANPTDFDRLVDDLATRASDRERGRPPRGIDDIFARYGVALRDREAIQATYRHMCELHDEQRNHIWGFFVRNQSRPTWFARSENRVDVLVGNPPWLSYRYMPPEMQEKFRQRCQDRGLWTGRQVATQQDLSAYFVARSIEQYLRVGGSFGFVMPLAVLSRRAYRGFRTGEFAPPHDSFKVAFETPWDLDGVEPGPFPVPSSVVLGNKRAGLSRAVAIPRQHLAARGRVDEHGGSGGGDNLTWELIDAPVCDEPQSDYADRFRNGATLYPRTLILVDSEEPHPLQPQTMTRVRSHRGNLERPPWRDLPDQTGVVENIFVMHVFLGEHCLPFRMLEPARGIIPFDGQQVMDGSNERIDHYPGLAEWWRANEQVWEQNKSGSTQLDLRQQADYHGKLSSQFPIPSIRVVYTKAGNYLTAAVVRDQTAIIDHKLYWGTTTSMDEAHYILALLNSPALGAVIQPYQSRGAFGPRDFDKYVWCPPIAEYNPANNDHHHLAELGARAEAVASQVVIPDGTGFQRARRLVRDALSEQGVIDEVDEVVASLLEP